MSEEFLSLEAYQALVAQQRAVREDGSNVYLRDEPDLRAYTVFSYDIDQRIFVDVGLLDYEVHVKLNTPTLSVITEQSIDGVMHRVCKDTSGAYWVEFLNDVGLSVPVWESVVAVHGADHAIVDLCRIVEKLAEARRLSK